MAAGNIRDFLSATDPRVIEITHMLQGKAPNSAQSDDAATVPKVWDAFSNYASLQAFDKFYETLSDEYKDLHLANGAIATPGQINRMVHLAQEDAARQDIKDFPDQKGTREQGIRQNQIFSSSQKAVGAVNPKATDIADDQAGILRREQEMAGYVGIQQGTPAWDEFQKGFAGKSPAQIHTIYDHLKKEAGTNGVIDPSTSMIDYRTKALADAESKAGITGTYDPDKPISAQTGLQRGLQEQRINDSGYMLNMTNAQKFREQMVNLTPGQMNNFYTTLNGFDKTSDGKLKDPQQALKAATTAATESDANGFTGSAANPGNIKETIERATGIGRTAGTAPTAPAGVVATSPAGVQPPTGTQPPAPASTVQSKDYDVAKYMGVKNADTAKKINDEFKGMSSPEAREAYGNSLKNAYDIHNTPEHYVPFTGDELKNGLRDARQAAITAVVKKDSGNTGQLVTDVMDTNDHINKMEETARGQEPTAAPKPNATPKPTETGPKGHVPIKHAHHHHHAAMKNGDQLADQLNRQELERINQAPAAPAAPAAPQKDGPGVFYVPQGGPQATAYKGVGQDMPDGRYRIDLADPRARNVWDGRNFPTTSIKAPESAKPSSEAPAVGAPAQLFPPPPQVAAKPQRSPGPGTGGLY